MADLLDRLHIRLRDRREALGVSQQRVGECCDPPVNKTAVHKWETGENHLPIRAIEGYSKALGIPIDVVLDGVRPEALELDSKRTALVDEVIAVLPQVPDDELPAFRKLLQAFRK